MLQSPSRKINELRENVTVAIMKCYWLRFTNLIVVLRSQNITHYKMICEIEDVIVAQKLANRKSVLL